MTKVLYMIPWFQQKTTLPMYKQLVAFLQKEWFKVIPVTINRKYKVMSDYTKEFLSQYNKHSTKDDVYIWWFSFGAMIAYITSPETKPKAQFLCSLSPYFQEDLPGIRDRRKKALGIKRVHDFDRISFDQIAKKVKCKTYLFAWSLEVPELHKRAKAAKQKVHNSELHIISGGKHDISQDVYVNKVKEVMRKI